jgi:DNA-binding transcriptional ArsR family regulator
MLRFAQSSNLVFDALATQGRYTDVYVLYRALEAFEPNELASVTNADLSGLLGVSETIVRRHLKILERLDLVRVMYTSADKATRKLALSQEFSSWTVRSLKGIKKGDLVPDVRQGILVHERGLDIDCAAKTATPLRTAGAKGPSKGTIGVTQFSTNCLDQLVVKETACEVQQSELKSEEQELPREGKQPKNRKRRQTYSDWPEARKADVTRLIDLWRELFDYARAQHTDDRRAKVNARLEEGYSVEDLEQVLRIAVNDPWWRGHNDRQTPYDDVIHLFRTGSRVDQFLARAKRGLTGKPRTVDRLRPDLAVSSKPVEEELL